MTNAESVRQIIYDYECIETGNTYISAAGIEADVKIDFDHVKTGTPGFERCMVAMAPVVKSFEPDLIVPAPEGANRFTSPLTRLTRITSILVHKDRKAGGFTVRDLTAETQRILNAAERIVIVEDVMSLGATTLRLAEFLGIERIAGVVPLVDRGRTLRTIESVQQAIEATRDNPTRPPVHVPTPYEVRPVLRLPLGLKR